METTNTIRERPKKRRKLRKKFRPKFCIPSWFSLVYFAVTFAYLEIIFNIRVFDGGKTVFHVLFAIPAGILAGTICNLFSEKIARVLRYVVSVIVMVLFSVQVVYHNDFHSFMSLSQVGMADDVMTNFSQNVMLAIWKCSIPILLFFLPLVELFFLQRYISPKRKFDWKSSLISGTAWLLSYLLVILSLPLGGKGSFSAYANFHDNWQLDLSMEKLGVLTTTRLDVQKWIFGSGEMKLESDRNAQNLLQSVADNGEENEEAGGVVQDPVTGETIPPEKQRPPYNTIEGLDFAALAKGDNDKKTQKILDYLAQLEPTKTNKYTGMFEGYNLILITAESFSPLGIHPELTPTLYKLANSGFDFTNYWTTYPSNTTNGEYSNLTGLMPDISKPKSDGSFVYSAKNTMNMNIAHYFNAQGATSRGYHDHTATYYKRNKTHPNLGYVFKGKGDIGGLTGWPESDLIMMQNTIPEYINDDVFHTYYMTVSGHHNYKFGGYNSIADKNKDLVKDLDMGTAAKAYLATHIELDRALEYLIQELEKAGKLEKTVICLTTDHYPYGLTDSEWKGMIGHSIQYGGLERYKSDLIIWNSEMETIKIDKPACQVDVLPTLLNLFGFDYDSRLYSGCDILSSNYGLAMFSNQSFVTDKIIYNTRYEKVYYLDENWVMPEGYLDACIDVVKNRFSIASNILNTNFYAKLPADVIEAAHKNME